MTNHENRRTVLSRRRKELVSSLFLVILVFAPAESRSAERCYRAFQNLTLAILAKPVFAEEKSVCGEDYLSAALASGFPYVLLDSHPDAPVGVSVVVEVKAKDHQILHFLRGEKYFGEFIDQTLDKTGGHKKDILFLLTEEPGGAGRKTPDLSELVYYGGTNKYLWSDERVERVDRKYRLMTISAEGKTKAKGDWEESVGIRRVVVLNVGILRTLIEEARARARGRDKPVVVEIYYFDPFLDRLQLFRRFSLRKSKQLTVLQFVGEKGEKGSYAVVKFMRGTRQLDLVKLFDPGTDYFDLKVAIEDKKEEGG